MNKPRNLNVALIVIALAQLRVVLDVAIVNGALPSIQRELHFAAADLEWVVNAYAIAFGGLLLCGGRTGDLSGRRGMSRVGALMVAPPSFAGGVALTAGGLLLVYGLAGVATHDWSDSVTRATLIIAVAFLITFVLLESRGRSPLMPLRIFANRNRSGAYMLSLAIGASLSGTLFVLTLFLQNVLGFTPLQAGFAFLPTALGVIVGAEITSRVIARVGPRVPMTTGALMAAIGMFWLSAVTVHATYFADVVGPLAVLAIGLGMAFVSTSATAISAITPSESGLASALLNVGRQLGGSLGIPNLGSVAATLSRNQLGLGRPTHAAENSALTAGFSTAVAVAGR